MSRRASLAQANFQTTSLLAEELAAHKRRQRMSKWEMRVWGRSVEVEHLLHMYDLGSFLSQTVEVEHLLS